MIAKRFLYSILTLGIALSVTSIGRAEPPKFEDVVTSVTATFDPAEAQAGDTVVLTITAELAPGWHTYPTVQESSAAKAFTDRLEITPPEGTVLVGDVIQPADPKEKSYPELGIKTLHYHEGTVTWKQEVKILPGTTSGTAQIKLQMQVCGIPQGSTEEVCLLPKKLMLTAELTVK